MRAGAAEQKEEQRGREQARFPVSEEGTQFTCFSGTKVRILTTKPHKPHDAQKAEEGETKGEREKEREKGDRRHKGEEVAAPRLLYICTARLLYSRHIYCAPAMYLRHKGEEVAAPRLLYT